MSAALPENPVPPAEKHRIAERDRGEKPWQLWGPYLPERQWGTVREDYSADGNAWDYFPYTQSLARAYRWGEDGLLGISNEDCRLCFSFAFWNGNDPHLKERPFGLSNPQGNHGEDVKDYFFHIDNTPTHSFQRGMYRYPHSRFPYEKLVHENAARGKNLPEFELIDSGIFEGNRFFDCFIEYAKAAPEDLLIRLRVVNRGPEPAALTVLPTLWFRNTWSWGEEGATRPEMFFDPAEGRVVARPWEMPEYFFEVETAEDWLFTENETNNALLFGGTNASPFTKDAFHRHVVSGVPGAVNPERAGTKCAARLDRVLAPGEEWSVRARLARHPVEEPFGAAFGHVFAMRESECAEFYNSVTPGLAGPVRDVQRAAFAGLLWNKKFYYYPVIQWLRGDPTQPAPPAERWSGRNSFWKEMHAHDVISMPDCWEYPYFCQWDLMFHSVVFALIDPATAKRQNLILSGERYTSPSAQQPAYEWALSDSNPPITGWAAWRIFSIERRRTGFGDRSFLKKAFNKLLLGYSWWANRVDQTGDNVFEGGFLGLDNIGVFDRRYPLPDGSRIEQSDGTAWMAASSLHMLNIAIELAREEPEYEDIADKFLNDFVFLAASINKERDRGFSLWDETDGFYYDVLKRPDGSTESLRTRSIAGITPLFAIGSFDADTVRRFPLLMRRMQYFSKHRPALLEGLQHIGRLRDGKFLVSLVPPDRLRRICARLFDENEFLSPFGLRSLSRVYLDKPYSFTEGGCTETLSYSPGDSPVGVFGGNSNWRGPVWIPMNYLVIEALQQFGFYLGDSFRVEFPTGSGRQLSLWEISLDLEKRILGLFLPENDGARPFAGDHPALRSDPCWRDLLQFHEYFHGDTGKGLGASHQTGWTALVAKMAGQLHTYEKLD